MSPVSRKTAAGRVYLDLQRMAKTTGRPTDELLRTYVLERFLWRIGNSDYRDRLILKGGMLLAVFSERRPTADVDLLALDSANELESVSTLVSEILAIEVDDGVVYALDQINAASIRDDDVYPGVRVTVPAAIERARLVLRVDVNVGDPVTPMPVAVEYPALLGEPFPIVGYPFETVLAEKIATMLDRGELTTRERDFADVHLLTGRVPVGADGLAAALMSTMEHRGSSRRSLFEALGGLGQRRQASWRAFVGSAGLDSRVPESYADVISGIVEFADPVIAGEVAGRVWDPVKRCWG